MYSGENGQASIIVEVLESGMVAIDRRVNSDPAAPFSRFKKLD